MEATPEIDYAEAHYPPTTWRICGVRLLPFRTGHKLVLQATHSPFFCSDKEFSEKDIIFALWACSRPYAEVVRGRVSLAWRILAFVLTWKLKRDQRLFFSRVEMFFKYLADGHARPQGMRSDSEAETTLAPGLMIFKRDLLLRYSAAEFWELPMRVAIYDRNAIIEQDGVVSWPEGWTNDDRFKVKNEPSAGGEQ